MPTPDNSLPTDVELREANFIFHEMNPEELREELEHGAKYVKFVVVRAQGACNVILMKSWVSPAIAIRDIPDCMAIGGGEIHEVEKKDVKSLPSLEEKYRTRPMTPDLMRIVSQRISRYLK